MTTISTKAVQRVLVIDDDAVMREVLQLLLEAGGHTVLAADSGAAALAMLSGLGMEDFPTVFLVDLRMPGSSPAKLAAQLRDACPSPAVLVAMSGSQGEASVVAAFDAFLRKPFTVADVDAAINEARNKVAGMPASNASSTVELQASGEREIATLDEGTYARLLKTMGMKQLPQVYSMLLTDTAMRIERMQSAVVDKDEKTLVLEAHAVKGGSSMLGARELHDLAARLEAGGLACSSLVNDFGPAVERLRRILEAHLDLGT